MQQRKVGKYPFSIDVEGAKPIEAVLVVGKTEGKTLVVTAGVHGDEYVAIQAVERTPATKAQRADYFGAYY